MLEEGLYRTKGNQITRWKNQWCFAQSNLNPCASRWCIITPIFTLNLFRLALWGKTNHKVRFTKRIPNTAPTSNTLTNLGIPICLTPSFTTRIKGIIISTITTITKAGTVRDVTDSIYFYLSLFIVDSPTTVDWSFFLSQLFDSLF